MDMSWQALLQEAAATSFEKTADTLAAAENDNCACIDLHQQQIHELSKKILLLPHQGRVLLLSRYCFRLSPEETEMFFHLENAKGHFRFYKELLSSSMGVEAGCMISDDTFVKACHIALKGYLHNELEADADDEAAGNNRTHIAFRKVWKTVAVAAITLTLLFSTCMVANAQFRERVISWVIETFEKYSIFELHGDELDEPQDLTEYQAGYLPDGAILQDTTKQPNTEPGIVLYKYAINEAESFEIMITQSDNRVYFDTENTKIEPFDKGGVTGYFFQKDGMSYICFERDGCFFSVYGSIDTDELVKIAASITEKQFKKYCPLFPPCALYG